MCGVPRLITMSVQPLQLVIEVIQIFVGSIAVLTYFSVVIW